MVSVESNATTTQEPGESAVLNFSGAVVDPAEVITFLKQTLQLKGVCRKLLGQQIIESAAQTYQIEVSPEAVQAEADRLRYERRLESAAATFTWLEEHMITAEEWEAGIYQRLLAEKLAEHLFESEIEKYFAQHRLDYDQLVLYKIIVSSQPVAQELCYQIEDQEISFYDAAHQYNLEEEGRLRCGYLGKLYRWSLKADLATHVFGATPGDVIGPLPSDQGYELLMIEAFIPAELTPEVRQEIRNKLFKEWLDRELNYRIHNTTLEVE